MLNILEFSLAHTANIEEIKTLEIGPGFTPFIFNVSIGYSFSVKRK